MEIKCKNLLKSGKKLRRDFISFRKEIEKYEDNFYFEINEITEDYFIYKGKKREPKKIFLPKGDSHFRKNKDRYQYANYLISLALLDKKRRGVAVDVGAHVGLYSIAMKENFSEVIAFDGDTENFICLNKNIDEIKSYNIIASDTHGQGFMLHDVRNSGGTHVESEEAYIANPDGKFRRSKLIECKPLDFFLEDKKIDLIKIDVQGFEKNVIIGLKNTLEKSGPLLIVEDNIKKIKTDIPSILNNIGYKKIFSIGKDSYYIK